MIRAVPKLAALSALALVAALTAAFGVRVAVPRMGDAIAARLVRAASSLPAPREAEPAWADGDGAGEVVARVAAGDGRSHREPPGRRGQTTEAIDVPVAVVARLSERQLRSVGATDAVDDGSGRVLGARLHGVGGLGSGLSDGDVVTNIDGRAIGSAADATAAALAAYASGETAAHATVLRDGRTLGVTVHIPPRAR
jgi:hypothetical protein